MTSRYSLRFETGERSGETVLLTGARFTVGRRPGNSLQIVDNSVSGKHAELLLEKGGVVLRDLGSTNGTRVGVARIQESALAHGDRITFGSVRLAFTDGELADEAPGGLEAEAEERTISAEDLARAGRGSRLGLALGALLLLLGGGAAWWFLTTSSAVSGGRSAPPVEVVAGNLLERGSSFEEDAGWSANDSAPVSFYLVPGDARSGASYLGAELEAGDWTEHASDPVAVTGGRFLDGAGWLRTVGAARVRLCVELSAAADDSFPVLFAWAPPASAVADFERFGVRTPVPPGYDRARVVVRASVAEDAAEGGEADVDDVSLLRGEISGPTIALDEYRIFALGDPTYSAVIFKLGSVRICDLEMEDEGGDPVAYGIAEESQGIALTAGDARLLRFTLDASLATVGLFTTGAGGFASHGTDFQRDGVGAVYGGTGANLGRVGFSIPASVRGRIVGDDFRFTAQLEPGTQVLLQIRFQEERSAVQHLVQSARDAEREGRLGDCLRLWQELLDTYPHERQHMTEAEETMGRLVRTGLAELRGLEAEVERAEFFRLVDLYRRCDASARVLGQRYAGSEVETEVLALLERIDERLAALEADLDAYEASRLRSILAALEAQGAEALSSEVRSYLTQRYGEQD